MLCWQDNKTLFLLDRGVPVIWALSTDLVLLFPFSCIPQVQALKASDGGVDRYWENDDKVACISHNGIRGSNALPYGRTRNMTYDHMLHQQTTNEI
jgi:hypothetical protein